jgi:tRNA threonylcarbamoyl adenosine modification protein YeaZ
MNILAIVTATVLCSAALQTENGVYQRDAVISGKHSTLIFEQIQQVQAEGGLARNQLDAVILSAGPGSFTGLRVGASAMKGFLFGSEVPMYAGSTLAGYALSVVPEGFEGRVHAIIDARRQHVYAGSYVVTPLSISEIHASGIVPLVELAERFTPGDVLTGTGIGRLPEGVAEGLVVFATERLSAVGLLRLYGISQKGTVGSLLSRVDVADFEPEYLSEGGW